MVRFIVAVALALSLAGCGKTTVEHAGVPSSAGATTSTTVPYDGRLHVSVVPESYAADSDALSSWGYEETGGTPPLIY
jgi:hypothetical protein